MANASLGGIDLNFPNANWVAPSGSNGSFLTTPANYASISAMRTALTAANGTYYTSAKLDQMTVNDMLFALRNIQDPTTIASYMTASAA